MKELVSTIALCSCFLLSTFSGYGTRNAAPPTGPDDATKSSGEHATSLHAAHHATLVHHFTELYRVTSASLCPDGNHPHAIDLGLKSGTKWACCNVGAKYPEAGGGFYAWGETEEKKSYVQTTYIFGDGSPCADPSLQIPDDIAGSGYDAARVNWGGSWQMPTITQLDELATQCRWQWVERRGVKGHLVTGKNGASIFLPAAGYRNDTHMYNPNVYGYIWSSTSGTFDSHFARGLFFGSRDHYLRSNYLYYGRSVRGVCK